MLLLLVMVLLRPDLPVTKTTSMVFRLTRLQHSVSFTSRVAYCNDCENQLRLNEREFIFLNLMVFIVVSQYDNYKGFTFYTIHYKV
jgi:hypothetical protein